MNLLFARPGMDLPKIASRVANPEPSAVPGAAMNKEWVAIQHENGEVVQYTDGIFAPDQAAAAAVLKKLHSRSGSPKSSALIVTKASLKAYVTV